MEMYDYPGKYIEKKRRRAIREDRSSRPSRRSTSGAMATAKRSSLFPGGLTKLERHPTGLAERRISGGAGDAFVCRWRPTAPAAMATPASTYFGSYEFLPSERPFRAPIVTPKPLINGIQTAKVVTKDDDSSEEIDVEELGEIYVRFYWDRKKKRSCRLRVAQVWSGKTMGRSDHSARRPGGRRLNFSKAIRTVRW